jgi:hypothetical protein
MLQQFGHGVSNSIRISTLHGHYRKGSRASLVRSLAKIMLATAKLPFEDDILDVAARTKNVDVVVSKLRAGSATVMVPVVRFSVTGSSVTVSGTGAVEVVCHSILLSSINLFSEKKYNRINNRPF